MITQVVAVRDSAMNAFGRPLFVPALGIALRSFTDEVNRKDGENQMHAHADDFELWHLAEFDESDGKFMPVDVRMLARGKDVKVQS